MIEVPVTDAFDAFQRVVRPDEAAVLFDSCPRSGLPPAEAALRRWSFVTAAPAVTVVVRDGTAWRRTGAGAWLRLPGVASPFVVARELSATVPRCADPGGAPFPGGVAGFLSYDAGRYLERVPEMALDDTGVPDAVFLVAPAALVVDHATQTARVVGWDRGTVLTLVDRLHAPPPARAAPPTLDPKPGLAAQAFEDAVEVARDFVHDGHVFQVNLSQRFDAAAPDDLDVIALYAQLRAANPAPMSGCFLTGALPEALGGDDVAVLSSSPERLFSASADGRIEARPIAGTRPRGATQQQDALLAAELAANAKERAEHVMLVDLARNDLGRVAAFGSVRVPRLLAVESYERVHHLVSTVEATLAPGKDAFDALAASFPGGTITGAPKVRAMELIEALEPVRRGAYTGGFGFVGADGASDWNILIRSLVATRGRVSLQVGAGIVWDSDPAREYAETLAKAEALFTALAGTPGRPRVAGVAR